MSRVPNVKLAGDAVRCVSPKENESDTALAELHSGEIYTGEPVSPRLLRCLLTIRVVISSCWITRIRELGKNFRDVIAAAEYKQEGGGTSGFMILTVL